MLQYSSVWQLPSVVAAVIERDGRVLIGQRLPGASYPLRWEFPGGKVEDGENPREALVRELREELDIEAEIGEEITRYEFTYSDRPPILLIFHRVIRFSGEPRNLSFHDLRWEEPGRLAGYDFLDGDVRFIQAGLAS